MRWQQVEHLDRVVHGSRETSEDGEDGDIAGTTLEVESTTCIGDQEVEEESVVEVGGEEAGEISDGADEERNDGKEAEVLGEIEGVSEAIEDALLSVSISVEEADRPH